MGVKAIYLLIWSCYLMTPVTFVAGLVGYNKVALALYVLDLFLVIPVICFYIRTQVAKRKSKRLGLTTLVLLPVSRRYVTFLLRLGKKSINLDFQNAYELHVNKTKKIDPKEFNQLMINDLALLKEKLNNVLFIWETNVPIPGEFRKLIKQEEQKGMAVWQKGGWPIKAPPLTVNLKFNKKYVRHGAFILK